MDTYVERLHQIRIEKGMSIEECADLLQMHPQYLTMIELGEMQPTPKQLQSIVEFVIDKL